MWLLSHLSLKGKKRPPFKNVNPLWSKFQSITLQTEGDTFKCWCVQPRFLSKIFKILSIVGKVRQRKERIGSEDLEFKWKWEEKDGQSVILWFELHSYGACWRKDILRGSCFKYVLVTVLPVIFPGSMDVGVKGFLQILRKAEMCGYS